MGRTRSAPGAINDEPTESHNEKEQSANETVSPSEETSNSTDNKVVKDGNNNGITNISSVGNGGKLSIRIRLNASSSSKESVTSPTSSPENSESSGKSSAPSSESENVSKRRQKKQLGRKRNKQDSDDSAYSESDFEEEGSESDEEVYSEDEASEESDEEYSGEETDDETEVWDSRRKAYVRKTPRSSTRVHQPNMAIPFQYNTFAPIAPLPSSMVSIPMFRTMRPAVPSPGQPSVAPLPATGVPPSIPMAHQLQMAEARAKLQSALFEKTYEIVKADMVRRFMATSPDAIKKQPPSEEKKEAEDPTEKEGNTSSAPTAAADESNSTESIPEKTNSTEELKSPSSTSTEEPKSTTSVSLEDAIKNFTPSPEQDKELKAAAIKLLAIPDFFHRMLGIVNREAAQRMQELGSSMARPFRPISGSVVPIPMGNPMYRFPPLSHYKAPPPPRPRQSRSKRGKTAMSQSSSGDNTPLAARRERRSCTKKVNYKEQYPEAVSDEEEEFQMSANDSEGEMLPQRRVPKGVRRHRKVVYDENEGDSDVEGNAEDLHESGSSDDVGVEKILSYRLKEDKTREFFVKYHNMAYIHCEWISEEEMNNESMGASRIKRFISKPTSLYNNKHPYNPEFDRIDRIIHGWEHSDEANVGVKTWSYYVKWRALPYSEATWEKKETIMSLPEGADKLEEFSKRPTLQQKRMASMPAGWRPDRADHQNLTESPEYNEGNKLRTYQLEGLNWLLYCWTNRQSCIIADEMGLGKTVQSVAFANYIYTKHNIRGPFIVIAPLSTIPHWEREFEAWTDLNVVVYHGSLASRDIIRDYEFFYKDAEDKPIPEYYKFDVLITTYEMALSGFEHLEQIPWRVGIFDEAHRLKNRQSKASETLKAFNIEHKVLLSGTPLQNNIEELWSLLNFLQPQRFVSEAQFTAEYGNLKKSEDVIRLQELLKPLMLRRLKEDVEKSIPVKEETVIEVELTSIQKRYYRAILERNFAFLTKGIKSTNAPNLINTMMELRKCCIHPYLISGAEDRIVTECGATELNEQMSCMIQSSGKLVLVDKLLKKLRENGHKVLIFSQMTRCLDLLVDYLRWRNYPFERIDGAIKGQDRQAAIDRFCDPTQDSFVFLLCTRAGGVGINLTAADTVVIFDSDWNPQNDIQAQARCHRIGQTKSVKVYRLLTRNTYEREMFDKAGLKLGLDRAVLRKILPDETLEGATHNPQLSKKEVETLLKKGAYGLLMENDDDAIRFCEEDIDQILERRTTVIRHGGEQEEGASIFSKASFAATADDMDIDIDDPNFWELWARRLDLDPRQLLSSSGVVVDEPRIKRQARRLRNENLRLDGFIDKLDSLTAETSKLDKKGTGLPGEPNLWTSEERADFLKEFLRFGIHRYDDMISKFPLRDKNDLIACSRAIIKLCLEEVENDDDIRLKEDNEKLLLAHLDFDRSAIESEVVDETTGNIDLAAAEIQNEELPLDPTAPSKEFKKADIPFSGASRRQIYEYRSFLRQSPKEFAALIREQAKPILLRIQLMDFIRQLVEGHATISKKGKGKKAKIEATEYHLPMPNIAGSGPTKSWGKVEDEALVIGIYRLGFGQYEAIKTDSSLPFSTMKWKVDGAEEGADEEAIEWPSEDSLDDRLKKVILAMEKKTQAAAKLAIQAANANETGARRRKNVFADGDDETYEEEYDPNEASSSGRGRQKKGAQAELKLSIRWSKRDRGEFQRVVCDYGLPPVKGKGRDWSTFKQLGDFAKTLLNAGDRPFEEYCDLFVKGCKAVAEKKGRKKSEVVDEDYEDETVNVGEDENSPLPVIPMERARKALAKIQLMDRLRKHIATLPDLETYLERVRKSAGLPSWWTTPEFDVTLLRGIAEHGFGRWDILILDESLLFRSIYEEADPEAFASQTEVKGETDSAAAVSSEQPSPSKKGRKKKDLTKGTPSGSKVDIAKINWPTDAVLQKRIESLIDAVDNELKRRQVNEGEGDEPIKGAAGKGGRKTKTSNKRQASTPAESIQNSDEASTARTTTTKRGRKTKITDYF